MDAMCYLYYNFFLMDAICKPMDRMDDRRILHGVCQMLIGYLSHISFARSIKHVRRLFGRMVHLYPAHKKFLGWRLVVARWSILYYPKHCVWMTSCLMMFVVFSSYLLQLLLPVWFLTYSPILETKLDTIMLVDCVTYHPPLGLPSILSTRKASICMMLMSYFIFAALCSSCYKKAFMDKHYLMVSRNPSLVQPCIC